MLKQLLFASLITITWADISISKTSSQITFQNNGQDYLNFKGFRIDKTNPFTISGASPTIKTTQFNNQDYSQYTFNDYWNISPLDSAETIQFQLAWGSQVPTLVQPLYKVGSCNYIHRPIDLTQLQLSQIQTLTPNYYDSTYRYPTPDKFSTNTPYRTQFYDSYKNQTQFIWAYPTNLSVNSTTTLVKPLIFNSPLSLMTLAMLQEYFNWDSQLLMSIWHKETFFMLEYSSQNGYKNYWSNTDGAYGQGEVERSTFLSRALQYLDLFPYENCLKNNSVLDNASAMQNCGFTDTQFANKYMQEQHTAPDSAYIVNSSLISALIFQSNFDLLVSSTDLNYKKAIALNSDPYLSLYPLLAMTNLGSNSGAESSLLTSTPQLLTASSFPNGNNNYKSEIISILKSYEQAAENVTNKISPNIAETSISKAEVMRFFFGEGIDLRSPWNQSGGVQKGGLLMHYKLSLSQREALWIDLEGAFNTLSAHWNNNTISLRYDWLTMLRIAKSHLDIQEHYIRGGEAEQWITGRSTTPTDSLWPFVNLETFIPQTDSMKLQLSASDLGSFASGIQSIEWSVDKEWKHFSSSYVKALSFDGKSGTWEISFPIQTYNQLKSQSVNNQFYVRTQDSCGQTIISQTTLPEPTKISRAQNIQHNGPSILFDKTPNQILSFKYSGFVTIQNLKGQIVWTGYLSPQNISSQLQNLAFGRYRIQFK